MESSILWLRKGRPASQAPPDSAQAQRKGSGAPRTIIWWSSLAPADLLQACLPTCLACLSYSVSGKRGTGWHSLVALALAIVKLVNPHLVHHLVPEVVWIRSGLTGSVENRTAGGECATLDLVVPP